jgi:hypothetical protein
LFKARWWPATVDSIVDWAEAVLQGDVTRALICRTSLNSNPANTSAVSATLSAISSLF